MSNSFLYMLDIIRTLPVNLEIRCGGTDYLLVHGGPLGYRHRYDDPVRDSVWMRLDETTALPEGKTVIFGHTPTIHYQSGSPMRIYHGSGWTIRPERWMRFSMAMIKRHVRRRKHTE